MARQRQVAVCLKLIPNDSNHPDPHCLQVGIIQSQLIDCS